MTATTTLSTGPRLGKTDKGVHIILLSLEALLAGMVNKHPSKDELLSEAAKHVGAPKKTDIVVHDHKPWHVVNGQLQPHPQVHVDDPETILTLSFKDQERAVWWSEQPFRITRIERSHHHPAVAESPDYPFTAAPPYDARPQPGSGGTIFVVESTTIVKKSIGQMYKISFFMGEEIDPDMSCGG